MSERDNQKSPPKLPEITLEDIQNLLVLFSKKTYHATADDEEYKTAFTRVLSLLVTDYNVYLIENSAGDLSYNYPSRIPIFDSEIEVNQNEDPGESPQSRVTFNRVTEAHYMYDMMTNARLARCHGRFPVPVIFYNGRNICRSSTLSGGPEILGRMGYQFFRSHDTNNSNLTSLVSGASRPVPVEERNQYPEEDDEDDIDRDTSLFPFIPSFASVINECQFFNRVRNYDIKLLKTLHVDTIFDLMVENKKVKFGMYVSSSEKIDKEKRYADFNLVSIPYPGCEFFKEFRTNYMNSDQLHFNWQLAYCNANLCLPDDPILSHLNINWTRYQQWDLTTLTKNYMKYILNYIRETDSGILIHCISGWDRTPLFVSLIRLSLWADGLIHKKLNAMEILYLTLVYDWMLFGHHLCDRLAKEEDIFLFCFYFLKHLSSSELSILPPIVQKDKMAEPVLEPDNEPEPELEPKQEPKEIVQPDDDTQVDAVNYTDSSVDLKPQDAETSNTPGLLFVDDTSESLPSSPQSRLTSPIDVLMESPMKHMPLCTCTSQGVEGWQHVTSTGSLKGSDSSNSQDSNSMNANIDDDFPESFITPKARKDRLMKVRSIFYKAYWTTIGKDIPQYKTNPLFTTFMNEVAETVKNFTKTENQK